MYAESNNNPNQPKQSENTQNNSHDEQQQHQEKQRLPLTGNIHDQHQQHQHQQQQLQQFQNQLLSDVILLPSDISMSSTPHKDSLDASITTPTTPTAANGETLIDPLSTPAFFPSPGQTATTPRSTRPMPPHSIVMDGAPSSSMEFHSQYDIIGPATAPYNSQQASIFSSFDGHDDDATMLDSMYSNNLFQQLALESEANTQMYPLNPQSQAQKCNPEQQQHILHCSRSPDSNKRLKHNSQLPITTSFSNHTSIQEDQSVQESCVNEIDSNRPITRNQSSIENSTHKHTFKKNSKSHRSSKSQMGFDLEDPQSFAPTNAPHLIHHAGHMLMVGLDGNKPTAQIRELITKYRVGSIILSAKNMRDAPSTQSLILELQQIARDAGHEHPLLIAVDQENGMLNNLYDDEYLSQFPGNMAIVAAQSTTLARDVAEATGRELKALGINWILGPVVDVLTNSTNRLLGVRTMGDDPQQVTEYAKAVLKGYAKAGIAACGKHFPGYGNATVDSMLGLPIVPDSIEQLEAASLIPFRQIANANIDSIMVGGCALPKVTMNDMHACLSHQVVQGLLRKDMKYDGVVVSECLEMKTLFENVGVRQGAVMAATAGCDVIIVCSSYKLQLEAISGIFGAVRDSILDQTAVEKSARRVIDMKRRHLSWETALNPCPLTELLELKQSHAALANTAYQKSITVLRDHAKYIPLQDSVEPDGDILLLTPIVSPIVASVQAAEDVFKKFGRDLARMHTGKILHASYTAKGFVATHERLLGRAKAVIVVTTDADRNAYQVGFSKYLGLLCSQRRKPMIAIAASSPYDLALDLGVGTYLCIYEFTAASLDMTAKVLFGRQPAVGKFPGSGLYQSRSEDRIRNPLSWRWRRRWLVEKWKQDNVDLQRRLKELWETCFPDRRFGMQFDVFARVFRDLDQTHFIVRNSSTGGLYGFCGTWVHKHSNVGCIMVLLVSPMRRGMSIGRSLHERAIKYLQTERNVSKIMLGSKVPSLFEGIPLSSHSNHGLLQPLNASETLSTRSLTESSKVNLVEWFRHMGWSIPSAVRRSSTQQANTFYVHSMLLSDLKHWDAPLLPESTVIFEQCTTPEQVSLVQTFILQEYGSRSEYAGMAELYQTAFSPASHATVIIGTIQSTVVGSLILFTRPSTLEVYMPWILEFEDARVGGLCGFAIDSSNHNYHNVADTKLGLITYGLETFKRQKILERCAIAGIEGDDTDILRMVGFQNWRIFLQVPSFGHQKSIA